MGSGKKGDVSGLLSYDGMFYHVCGKLFDMIAVSFFFLLGCSLVITAGASFCALYYAVHTAIRQDRRTVSSAFWRAFRQNLKPSVAIWLAVAAGMFLFLLNIGIVNDRMPWQIGIGFMIFYWICFAAVLAVGCYAFPALSRFEEPAGWIVKLSLYLTMRHLPTTLLLLLLLAACYAGIFFMPYAALLLPGFLTYVASYFLEPVLKRHMPAQEEVA